MKRAAVFGWGLVAPGAANIDEFEANLAQGGSRLEPFSGFGPDTFLVGRPKFDFAAYEGWLAERFAPSKSKQLTDKIDPTSLYAVGSFIQALGQNPGIERTLQELGSQAHVYVGNALGAYPTVYRTASELYRAQRRWNRFWSHPERNSALREFESRGGELDLVRPSTLTDPDAREAAEDAWFAYWAERSDSLQKYLAELAEVESPGVEGDVASGKMKVMRDKRRGLSNLQEKWNAPEPPWASVSANLLWNIPNSPASQISMLGKITGLAFAPIAACSTFGVALKLALDAIDRGEAKMVVVGSADPPPHAMTVGAFYSARVLSADGAASKPLTKMKGTHVAGGACIWIVGDLEYGLAQGFRPLGLEPLSVGVSSDADHIITPSEEGPRAAMNGALSLAGVESSQVVSWDLHATATPGDFQELENLQTVVGKNTVVSARKGTFGHGMGVGGGWELTAQYMGVASGHLYPTTLQPGDLHPSIAELGQKLVLDRPVDVGRGPVGKLSMGVGGINACVVSRPFEGE
ncbi:MAG TPA: beta-ketoacyl synthase N-terminal-like domain-containing protein [Polyangiaceae bacterium]|nr:beta-ketoacyl synthase N-terminal-like domain-containing protein [Polyangiaceae bacterium]